MTSVKGVKYDTAKPRVGAMMADFAGALTAVAAVWTHGAEKYEDGGWRTVEGKLERYTDAMQRHLLSELGGEADDPGSALPHAAHTAWNALCRLQIILEAAPAEPTPGVTVPPGEAGGLAVFCPPSTRARSGRDNNDT